MAVFAILRHILSLYSNQKTTCASSISAVRENRSPWNHQRFLEDSNIIVSFFCRVPVKEETPSHWCPSSKRASANLGTALQITRVQYVRYERFVNKNTRVLWQVSVDVVWLLSSCLLIQLMKRKRVRWKQEMTPFGNEVDWLLQASTVTWKRVVGAF